MIAIMLTRTVRQPTFVEQDGLNLARIFPALEALVRRNAKMEAKLESYPLMETLVELQSPLSAAFSLSGRLLWASKKATDLLKLGPQENRIPKELAGAVRQFQELFNNRFSATTPPTRVLIPLKNSEPVWAEFRIARTDSGEPFVVSEFDSPLYSPLIENLSKKYELTPTETKVFQLIALGMPNRDIAKSLFISNATVGTHVGRILAKLGVTSRVQAALLAHGLPIFSDEN